MHEHFAVIDQEIVWYGNFLSKGKEQDNLMRVQSTDIAAELSEMGFAGQATHFGAGIRTAENVDEEKRTKTTEKTENQTGKRTYEYAETFLFRSAEMTE